MSNPEAAPEDDSAAAAETVGLPLPSRLSDTIASFSVPVEAQLPEVGMGFFSSGAGAPEAAPATREDGQDKGGGEAGPEDKVADFGDGPAPSSSASSLPPSAAPGSTSGPSVAAVSVATKGSAPDAASTSGSSAADAASASAGSAGYEGGASAAGTSSSEGGSAAESAATGRSPTGTVGQKTKTGQELCAAQLAYFATLLSAVRIGDDRPGPNRKLERLLSMGAVANFPSLRLPDLVDPVTVRRDKVATVADDLLGNVAGSFGAALAGQCSAGGVEVGTANVAATFSVEDAANPKFTVYNEAPLVMSVPVSLEFAIDVILPPPKDGSGSAGRPTQTTTTMARTATATVRATATATGAYSSPPKAGEKAPPLEAVDVKVDAEGLKAELEAEARRVAGILLPGSAGAGKKTASAASPTSGTPDEAAAAAAASDVAVTVTTGTEDSGPSPTEQFANEAGAAASVAAVTVATGTVGDAEAWDSSDEDRMDDGGDLMDYMSDMTSLSGYDAGFDSDDSNHKPRGPTLDTIAEGEQQKEQQEGGAPVGAGGSSKAGASAATLDGTLSYLTTDACPLCVIVLDALTGRAVKANSSFVEHFGPVYKFSGYEFSSVATDDDEKRAEEKKEELDGPSNRAKFRDAIETVRDGMCRSARARNIQMLTLAGEAGLPRRRYFDWTVGSGPEEGGCRVLLLYGDPCTPEDEENRHRDAELIDFFQNAPIAMHWLSGEGIVLWANQTELNVLGYTAEEYIGQPIMKFCPDEEELVLEIFKTLGSGNTIKDVPVRFRTKDGKIVHLLIDSNVAYKVDGSFGHTRCFIRDDTQRKVREARSSLLLEEMRRSLRMLDGFMTRTLHHVMQPLHSLQLTCDIVAGRIRQSSEYMASPDSDDNVKLLTAAGEDVASTVRMVCDVADLNRFDQGASMKVDPISVDLRDVGVEAMGAAPFPSSTGVAVYLELEGEGPGSIRTDRAVLLRVLGQLLDNAIRVTKEGRVMLRIGYPNVELESSGVTFVVEDTGPGLPIASKDGDSNAMFQRYHNEELPQEGQDTVDVDYDDINDARSRIEDLLTSREQVGMGIGLPLSYHLVRSLGGDLRYQSEAGQGTKFWFTLPIDLLDNIMIMATADDTLSSELLQSETILKDSTMSPQNTTLGIAGEAGQENVLAAHAIEEVKEIDYKEPARRSTKRHRPEFIDFQDITDHPVKASDVAGHGVTAMMLPSVLVVEDSDICAQLLCTQLRKFNCSTVRAENGQVALDILSTSVPGMFNLVLMDLRMPVMGGLECTRRLKANPRVNYLPIVALTGDIGENTKEECEKIGFNGFHAKPLRKETLGMILKEHCGYVPLGI